ncbi:hypothetical protein BFJ66_g17016 [Fusarium oxysporum f. sp. cepae]|uniref:Uncharacterized protein n=1 Tax=Fusarium oxysporum f. sp. cepae TaxID=396571 RepID=A0A3L6N266_FUSOX|nr:hypothetical protein BFJ65_g15041 [Fusarium oxysporum f. sp. cepae]RKK26666.1 hypothetical protein BFJ66_g17016 [Fusarium oxysporum f. sp. cepae]RKK27075.1 hypothetical protein BFJ67_g16316 [Fusarium oxysporum f. sp. cepae]
MATLASSEASATETSLEFFFTILPQDDKRIDGPAVFKYQYKVFKNRDDSLQSLETVPETTYTREEGSDRMFNDNNQLALTLYVREGQYAIANVGQGCFEFRKLTHKNEPVESLKLGIRSRIHSMLQGQVESGDLTIPWQK